MWSYAFCCMMCLRNTMMVALLKHLYRFLGQITSAKSDGDCLWFWWGRISKMVTFLNHLHKLWAQNMHQDRLCKFAECVQKKIKTKNWLWGHHRANLNWQLQEKCNFSFNAVLSFCLSFGADIIIDLRVSNVSTGVQLRCLPKGLFFSQRYASVYICKDQPKTFKWWSV